LASEPQAMRPRGRATCRYEDNIKMNLRETVWRRGLDWTGTE